MNWEKDQGLYGGIDLKANEALFNQSPNQSTFWKKKE